MINLSPMKIPEQKQIDDLLASPEVQRMLDDQVADSVIEMDPKLSKLTYEQREKLKANWRQWDKWEDRLRGLFKKILG